MGLRKMATDLLILSVMVLIIIFAAILLELPQRWQHWYQLKVSGVEVWGTVIDDSDWQVTVRYPVDMPSGLKTFLIIKKSFSAFATEYNRGYLKSGSRIIVHYQRGNPDIAQVTGLVENGLLYTTVVLFAWIPAIFFGYKYLHIE